MIQMPTDANPVTVVNADCLEVLRELPDGCVDAVVTDPPYGISFQSARRIETERFNEIANDGAPYVWWLADVSRLLKPGGCLVCFCRWDTAEAFRLSIGWAGLKVGAQLVWDRVIHGLGDLTGRPAPQHDTIWFAVKGRYKLPGKRPSSVYRQQRLGGDELRHPNEKPVTLMRRLIEDYVPPGGIVIDPFGGSGTTAVAALHEGRKCIIIERDPTYCEIIRRRVKEATDDGLFAVATPEQPSLFTDAENQS